MTDSPPRAIRDILAECLRVERLGPTLWSALHEEAREPVRMRADHIIRMLAAHGLSIVRTGEPVPVEPLTSPVVWQSDLHGRNAQRVIRRTSVGWELVTIADGAETVDLTFTMQEADIVGGSVLKDEPDVRKIVGLGRKLAAALEIRRVNAETSNA